MLFFFYCPRHLVSYLKGVWKVVVDYENIVDEKLYAVIRSNPEDVYSTYGWGKVCFIYGSKSLSKAEPIPWENCEYFFNTI